MPPLKHIHTYSFMERRNGEDYFKCDDPLCTHFQRRSLIVGKISMCSKCRANEVLLDYKQLNARKNPLCTECQETKFAKTLKETKSLMENLLKGE